MGFRSSLKKLMGKKEAGANGSEPVKDALGDKEIEPNKASQRTFPSYGYMQELKLKLEKKGSATSSSAEAVKPMGGVSGDGGASQEPSQEPDQEASQEEETKEGEDAAADAVIGADAKGEKEDDEENESEEEKNEKSTDESDDMSSDEDSSSDGSDSDEKVKEDKKAKKKEEKTEVATKGEIEEPVEKEPEEKPEEEEDKEKDQPEEKPKEDKKKSRRFFPFSFIRRKKKEPKKKSEFTIEKESSKSKFFGDIKKVAGFMKDVAVAGLKYNPFTMGFVQAKGVIDALTGKKKTDLYKMSELKDYYDNMIFFKTSVSKDLWNKTAIEVEKRAREKIANEYGVSEVVMIPDGELEDKAPSKDRIQIIYNREVLNCLPIADESMEKALADKELKKKTAESNKGDDEQDSENNKDNTDEEVIEKEEDDPTSKSFSLPDLITKLTGKAYKYAASKKEDDDTGGSSSNSAIFNKFGGTMNYMANMDYRALILKEWSLHGALAKRLDSFYGVEEKKLKDTSFNGSSCQDVDTEGHLYCQNAKPSLIRTIKKEMMLDKGSANKIDKAKSADDNTQSGEFSDAETQKMVGEMLVKRRLVYELKIKTGFDFSYASLSDEEKERVNTAYEGLKKLDSSEYHSMRSSDIKGEEDKVLEKARRNLNLKPLIERYAELASDKGKIFENFSEIYSLVEDIKGATELGNMKGIEEIMEKEIIGGDDANVIHGQIKTAANNVLLILGCAEGLAKNFDDNKGIEKTANSTKMVLPTRSTSIKRDSYFDLFNVRSRDERTKKPIKDRKILKKIVDDFIGKGGMREYLGENISEKNVDNWINKNSKLLERNNVVNELETGGLISFGASSAEKDEEIKRIEAEKKKLETKKNSGSSDKERIKEYEKRLEELRGEGGEKYVDTAKLPTSMKYKGESQGGEIEIVLRTEKSSKSTALTDTTEEKTTDDENEATNKGEQNPDDPEKGDNEEENKDGEGEENLDEMIETLGNGLAAGSLNNNDCSKYVEASFKKITKKHKDSSNQSRQLAINILVYKLCGQKDLALSEDDNVDYSDGKFKQSFKDYIASDPGMVQDVIKELHQSGNRDNLVSVRGINSITVSDIEKEIVQLKEGKK